MKSIFSTFNFTGRPIDMLASAQIMFDTASANQKVMFERTYIDEWFDVLPPQFGLTVKAIVGKTNIRFMASVIGNDAATPLRPTDGFDVWTGEIPRIGHKFLTTADSIRSMKELFENNRVNEDAKAQRLQKLLVTDLRDGYLGCKDVASSIVLQALSNNGVAVFNALNNADGRKYKVDYAMPNENKIVSPKLFTEANKDTIDILSILQKIKFDYQAKGIVFGEMLMAPEILYWILATPKLKQVIHGTDKINSLVTEEMFNHTLTQWGLPRVRTIVKKNAINKDGKRVLVDHWNSNYICLKPEGKLGELQPAFEDNEIIEEPDVTYMNADAGIRIAKWVVGESTGQKAGEYTQASWRAVPVIDNIDQIVNIKIR